MVIEAKSIKGSAKGLRYQADDKGLSVEICRNGLLGEDPNQWHLQMRSIEIQNTRVENYRFSVVIAPSKEVSRTLNHNDWENLVNSYLDKMGIDRDNYQYISHLHTSTDDPHLHLTISRIPLELGLSKFKAINDNNIGVRSGSLADKIAKENGWRTAKEISAFKRKSIEDSLRIVLKSARNFTELSKAMATHGYVVKLSENEAKGIYGMRIIPVTDINEKPSDRALNSKQGYKLSDLERYPDKKAKFRISDIKIGLERNLFKTLSPEEKIEFYNSKNDKIFNQEITGEENRENVNSESVVDSKETVKTEKGILEHLLKPNYSQSSEDDFLKKKRKKRK